MTLSHLNQSSISLRGSLCMLGPVSCAHDVLSRLAWRFLLFYQSVVCDVVDAVYYNNARLDSLKCLIVCVCALGCFFRPAMYML